MSSAGAEVLAVLIEQQNEAINISEVARRSRIPSATANRVVTRLVAAGLVDEEVEGRERLVRINSTNPQYAPITELLWISLGVVTPPPPLDPRVPYEAQRLRLAPGEFGSLSMPRGVPEELREVLRAGHLPGPSFDVDDGPPAAVVRRLVVELRDLTDRSSHLLAVLMEARARWSDTLRGSNRDRELSHYLMSRGGGASVAAGVLRHDAARFPRQIKDRREDLRDRTHGGRKAWTFATYALATEAAELQLVADHLSAALAPAESRHLARVRLDEAREDAERTDAGTKDREAAEAGVVRATAELDDAKADVLRFSETFSAGEYVGAAGERLLIVDLEVAAFQARALAARMAQAPCVSRWLEDHPDVAAAHPLPRADAGSGEYDADQERLERFVDTTLPPYGRALADLGQ